MNKGKTLHLTTLALLAALTVLLGMTPLGMLNLGFVYVTLLCLPVVIGTVILGVRDGLILSLCFATVSFFTGLNAPSALVAPLLAKNVAWVAALCYLPRLMIPLVTNFVYTRIKKKHEKPALVLSAFLGSLTNTVCYMGAMLLFYVLTGIDSAPLLSVLAGIVFGAGLAEAAVAAIVTYPVVRALQKTGLTAKLAR